MLPWQHQSCWGRAALPEGQEWGAGSGQTGFKAEFKAQLRHVLLTTSLHSCLQSDLYCDFCPNLPSLCSLTVPSLMFPRCQRSCPALCPPQSIIQGWGKDADPFPGLQSAGPWDNFPPSTVTVSAWGPSQTQFSPVRPGSGLCPACGGHGYSKLKTVIAGEGLR